MTYHVYVMASLRRVLYIGVTGRLAVRVAEHKAHFYPDSFTARYDVTRLVYCEEYSRIEDALAREKQMKGWRRSKKVRLIQNVNPDWRDYCEPPARTGPSLRSG
jgi:putative endonuclease